MFDELCGTCNGRGKMTIEDYEGNLQTIECEDCDGTGIAGEFETFQPYRRRGHSRYIDDDEY